MAHGNPNPKYAFSLKADENDLEKARIFYQRNLEPVLQQTHSQAVVFLYEKRGIEDLTAQQ